MKTCGRSGICSWFSLIFRLLFLIPATFASSHPTIWSMPSWRQSNLSQTFVCGQTVALSWKGFNESRHDLWLTTWDYDVNPYSSILAWNIDVSYPAILPWVVNLPASQLVKSAKYVLKFKPVREDHQIDLLSWEEVSPAFLIVQSASGDCASQSSEAVSSRSYDNSDVLSPGDRIGIAFGVVALVSLMALISWLMWRRFAEMRHRERLSQFRDFVRIKGRGTKATKKPAVWEGRSRGGRWAGDDGKKAPPPWDQWDLMVDRYIGSKQNDMKNVPGLHELAGSNSDGSGLPYPSPVMNSPPVELYAGLDGFVKREERPSPSWIGYHPDKSVVPTYPWGR